MPMNNRIMAPRQTTHPEALAWRTAVIANGGTVSGGTLNAVSNFFIATASIRDRLYRVNLFCGTGLAACLTPQVRGPSRTGTQYGNTTDTNNNFVAGDYNETGSSCGLDPGAGVSTKSLQTGFPGNTLTGANSHIGVGLRRTTSIAGYRCLIGCQASPPNEWAIYARRATDAEYGCQFCEYGAGAASKFGDLGNAFLTAGNLIATWPNLYRDGSVSGATGSVATNFGATNQVGVFATGAPGNNVDARMDWYSIGAVMTGAQVTIFNTAIVAFQTALSRS